AAVIELLERRPPPGALSRARAADAGEAALADPALTTRELEVLGMVAQGMLARTVAARLQVSPRTVHKHLGNAYRKLDAHDRLVAVRRAERLGLLTGPSTQATAAAAGIVVPAPSQPRDDALTLRW